MASTYMMANENAGVGITETGKGAAVVNVKRAPLIDISNNAAANKFVKVDPVSKHKRVHAEIAVEVVQETVAMDLEDTDFLDLDDLDATHTSDPQWVGEYVSDIFEHYFAIESVNIANANYMESQKDLRPDMRRILIDWLVEVHTMFKLKPETLFLAINLLDRYLSIKPLKRTNLQLVGSTALFVASKYEEMYAPEVEDFVYVADKAFSRDDVLMCESELCTSLEFLLSVPTPFHFSQRFVQVAAFDERNSLFASYLMELALLEYSFLCYSPSVIAASAVYLTTYFDGQPWADLLVQHTRYTYADIRPCVKELYALLASEKTVSSVQKKYSTKTMRRVAQIGAEVVQAQIKQHQEQTASQ